MVHRLCIYLCQVVGCIEDNPHADEMKRRTLTTLLATTAKRSSDITGCVASEAAASGCMLGSRTSSLLDTARQIPPRNLSGLLMQHRSAAMPAVQQAAVKALPELVFSSTVHATRVDEVGAVSMVEDQNASQPAVYRNLDGHRVEDGRYAAFMAEIGEFLPSERQYTDPVRTFAYGTDASFYRLNPKVVVKIHSEAEVARILPIALKHRVPVTFRAAGTSLSGQALTDSVLLKLSHAGKAFRGYTVHVRRGTPLFGCLTCGISTP